MTDLSVDSPTPAAVQRTRPAQGAVGVKNLQQLVQLRWIAVVGQVVTIEVAREILGLALPYRDMLMAIGCLILFNVVSVLRLRLGGQREASSGEVFVALLVDVGVLTLQLYLSGGIANPFVFLYLLQVTLGAVLLRGPFIWLMVTVITVCFGILADHHRPLPGVHDQQIGFSNLYATGLAVCFLLNALLVSVFMTRIQRNLRERDARLAAARRRRVEEEHIVRMGLLASGAAHELGTPLSTLAVILGDWKRDPQLREDPVMREDIEEMESQVSRCKRIVSDILLSVGETRGEASAQTTVRAFVDALVREWRSSRTIDTLVYENEFGNDVRMVSDTTFKQMVFNLLDNAREASPEWVRLSVTRQADELRIEVTDRGPGFAPQILSRVGTPYQSTKNRAGAGLGLFLVFNVARTLGGSVEVSNLPQGGGAVTIRLPLSSVALPLAPNQDHGI
jgi:two-component system, sensor histidine kinase RegB